MRALTHTRAQRAKHQHVDQAISAPGSPVYGGGASHDQANWHAPFCANRRCGLWPVRRCKGAPASFDGWLDCTAAPQSWRGIVTHSHTAVSHKRSSSDSFGDLGVRRETAAGPSNSAGSIDRECLRALNWRSGPGKAQSTRREVRRPPLSAGRGVHVQVRDNWAGGGGGAQAEGAAAASRVPAGARGVDGPCARRRRAPGRMGGCLSSPEADRPSPAKPGAAGARVASAPAPAAGGGGGGGGGAAAKSKVPDFGLAELWEVIKLLGTGEPIGVQRVPRCGACRRSRLRLAGGRRRVALVLAGRGAAGGEGGRGPSAGRGAREGKLAAASASGPSGGPLPARPSAAQAARARRGCAARRRPTARSRSSWCGAPYQSPSPRSSSGRSRSSPTWGVRG
jgi:hypothetical protein